MNTYALIASQIFEIKTVFRSLSLCVCMDRKQKCLRLQLSRWVQQQRWKKKARKEKSLEISARGIYAITATRNERKQLDIYKT